jgi:transcriptional regulator NrdR family protein
MKCPLCNAWTEQLETRKRKNGLTYRRYECGNLHRFTTEDHYVMRIDTAKRAGGRPAKEVRT